MRKLVVIGIVTTLSAAALLAIPASASFDHHFSVIARPVSGHVVGGTKFVFREHLFDPRNRRDRVGRDWSKCKDRRNTTKCRAHIHLNGEIGGFGTLSVSGDFGDKHDKKLNVTGGTHDFNGVAGKMLVHAVGHKGAARYHFDLVR
jgi:hypothetical protein